MHDSLHDTAQTSASEMWVWYTHEYFVIREVALLTAHVPAALRTSQPVPRLGPVRIDLSSEDWIQQNSLSCRLSLQTFVHTSAQKSKAYRASLVHTYIAPRLIIDKSLVRISREYRSQTIGGRRHLGIHEYVSCHMGYTSGRLIFQSHHTRCTTQFANFANLWLFPRSNML